MKGPNGQPWLIFSQGIKRITLKEIRLLFLPVLSGIILDDRIV